jgi:hypothetical protein
LAEADAFSFSGDSDATRFKSFLASPVAFVGTVSVRPFFVGERGVANALAGDFSRVVGVFWCSIFARF